jgi:hypothetical protein
LENIVKFAVHTHHLFDAIKKGRMLSGCYEEDHHRLIGMWQNGVAELEKVPTYVMRDPGEDIYTEELFEVAREWMREKRVKLPMPQMLLQVAFSDRYDPDYPNVRPPDDVWVIYGCTQEQMRENNIFQITPETLAGDPDAIWVFSQTTVVTELHEWGSPPLAARIINGEIQLFKIHKGVSPEYRYAEGIKEDLQDAASYLIATIVLMTSPSIEVEAVKIPREVNRGRSLLKKSRIRDHTVLRLPKIVYTKGEDRGGTHRRPRAHWRRPHDREYRPGKFTHIPLTLVAKREDEPLPPPPVTEIITR